LLQLAAAVVDLGQETTQFGDSRLGTQHRVDAVAETLGSPAQMRLQHLPNIHARRHTQRVQYDINRLAIGAERHILDRHDARDHALVAVASGHLVAGLNAPLHRDIGLDHLQHTWCQFVTLGDLALLDLEAIAELLALLLDLVGDGLELTRRLLAAQTDLQPLVATTLSASSLR
jgi:CheY-like chemotaxis protein